MINAISVNNFSKSFFNKKVVDNLTFNVNEGELFAFLGPNGSGKTTTIRTLLNILKPNTGSLEIFGKKYNCDMASLIGYLPEERGLYNNSSVVEVMTYFGQLKGLEYFEALKRTKDFLKRVLLEDKLNSKIKTLSSGQQQKIQFGLTLINKPKLLILDEPTKGLDPINRKMLTDILFELNKDNKTTILFSTHQMEEVERIADHVLMINKGKKVLDGKLKDIKKEYSSNSYILEYIGDIKKSKNYNLKTINKNKAVIYPINTTNNKSIINELNKNVEIISFNENIPSLEEIFISKANIK